MLRIERGRLAGGAVARAGESGVPAALARVRDQHRTRLVAARGNAQHAAGGRDRGHRVRSGAGGEIMTNPRNPFLPFTRPTIDEETIQGVVEVLRSGWL